MPAKHSRASTRQQRRMIQFAAAATTVLFVGVAASAVLWDRAIDPMGSPTIPAPVEPSQTGPEDSGYAPIPALIATGFASVAEIEEPPKTETPEGVEQPVQAPPQEIALVASIGRPGSMMAVIREGASQTALAKGQQAGSVRVLDVAPGWARVRHRGIDKELTVGAPLMLVSDMGAGAGAAASSEIIGMPDAQGMIETFEEGGVTQTRGPTGFQRARPPGNNPGGGSSRRGSRGRSESVV